MDWNLIIWNLEQHDKFTTFMEHTKRIIDVYLVGPNASCSSFFDTAYSSSQSYTFSTVHTYTYNLAIYMSDVLLQIETHPLHFHSN